ncbi:sulfatase-like hydrolase/transferase [Flavicella sp.]|uniref:sulfatase-like hydrolase/transferase n=1 Tax=Flavicella sp. TaxID=2957742 RepID=UPI00262690C3|nr:sulfatase-like hydrolase/transferase [Flavicella sp.]MDG1804653.1 sulfatase-like hydrolase/transferase [Flavicella sp.]MDG2279331.1 sulfatase-like hydrolase/transferase [Flavicella sp.]
MRFFKVIVLFLLFVQSVFSQGKPNIVMIVVDDFGYHDIGYHGSQIHQTPAIDNLAKTGVVFQNGYSSYPRCTPSRYGMFTGTYPVNESKGYLGGIPSEKNFIRQFNEAGYKTSYTGKWHIGGEESSPTGFGFHNSYAAGHAGGVDTRHYPFNTKTLEKAKANEGKKKKGHGEKYPVLNVTEDGKKGDYLSDVLTDATIGFIENRDKKKPFFTVLAYYAVHTPIEAKKEDEKRNQKEIDAFDYGDGPEYIKEGTGRRKMRQDNAAYAGMVENVDENIARVVATLKKEGLDKNTIIVVTSDHGGLSNGGFKGQRLLATTNLPFKAGKGWLYEGGIRVPYIINWPGTLKPKFDQESIVLGMDIIPTLLDLSIEKKVKGIDGKSFKSVLEGKETWEDRTVFWRSIKARPHSTGDGKTEVVRSGDYKLLYFKDTDTVELYNVVKDEGELNDLASAEPQKKKELMELLKAWKKEYLIPSKVKIYPPKK